MFKTFSTSKQKVFAQKQNEEKQISLLPLTIETVVSFDKISMARSETERIDRIPTKDGRRDFLARRHSV
jgi:hypothetical protein